MRASVVALAACGAGLLLVAACESKHAPELEAGPVAAVPPSASAPAASSANTSDGAHARLDQARETALHLPCRAIAVDGHAGPDLDAGVAGGGTGPLVTQAELSQDWIAISADSRVVAKDPRTTRETTFLGPARVRACVAHREESWVRSGRFESSIGAGETPGAEEWVVTPLGVVRYMAAKLAVDVGTDASVASVQVGSGAAFLWLPDDVGAGPGRPDGGPTTANEANEADEASEGWVRMGEGALKLTKRGPVDAIVRARTAVDRCDALTRRSRELASNLYAGSDAGENRGSEAKEQVRTRRLARAACDVADLRVDVLPHSASRNEMGARLEDAGVRTASLRPGIVPPEAGP